jgi:hypothetical protein
MLPPPLLRPITLSPQNLPAPQHQPRVVVEEEGEEEVQAENNPDDGDPYTSGSEADDVDEVEEDDSYFSNIPRDILLSSIEPDALISL